MRGLAPIQSIRAKQGEEGAPQVFEVAASSEYEVTRAGFFGMWREVLDHSPKSVDMERFKSGRAAVLVDHGGDQVGVIQTASVDSDRVMRAEVRFSRSARGREIEQDVADGIRQNISIGYVPKRAKLVEENEEKGDLWRISQWEPLELSFVSVPADPTVGVGRGKAERDFPPVQVEGEEPMKEERSMKKQVRGDSGALIEVDESDPRPAVTEGSPSNRSADRDALDELAEAFGYGVKDVRGWVSAGLTVEQVQRKILQERATGGKATPGSADVADELANAGFTEADAKRYSVSRAILAAADGRAPDGIEGLVHRFLEERRPDAIQSRNGVLVPMALTPAMKRTLTGTVAGKGAEAIFEQKGDLIELLRNRTVILQMGARSLTGLTSPINFPKQSGAASAVWVGENPTAISEADMTLALALFAPKTLMGATSYSRQLLVQGSLDVDNLVTDDLAKVHAIALDLAGIHGLGAAGEPTGVYKALGVGAKAVGGAMDYTNVLAMEVLPANSNALLGTLGWVMNPTMAANLKKSMKASNTWSPVWEGTINDGFVDGYKAMSSAQVSKIMNGSDRDGGSSLGAVFGDWSQMLVGTWGALELVVDPYTSKKKGLIEVASFQMADIFIRHGESFAKATGATG